MQVMQSNYPCMFRRVTNEDRNFICSSMARSYLEYRTANSGPLSYEEHASFYAKLKLLLAGAEILVACDPLRPGKIYGWIAYQHPAVQGGEMPVHYVYVRHEYRRQGVASQLGERIGVRKTSKVLVSYETGRARYFERNICLVRKVEKT